MSSSVNTSGLAELCTRIENANNSIHELQRAAHERLGEVLQRTVRGNISTSLNDSHGKIADWQDVFVGSGGGYVAVRTATSPAGRDGAGLPVHRHLAGGPLRQAPAQVISVPCNQKPVPTHRGRLFHSLAWQILSDTIRSNIVTKFFKCLLYVCHNLPVYL